MSAINCNRLCRHWGRSQEECISDTDGVCKGRDGKEFRDYCDTRFPCIYPDKCAVAAHARFLASGTGNAEKKDGGE